MADYTEHYQLHQWEPEDSFLRTDFNEDLQKIDTTLGELAEAAAQVAMRQLPSLHNELYGHWSDWERYTQYAPIP